MKSKVLFFVFVLNLIGCQEEVDFVSKSFSKAFGAEGQNWAGDIIEKANGNLIIVGNFIKPASINTSEPIDGPFIIETDPNGNQLRFRSYYFTQATLAERAEQYREMKGLPELSDEMTVRFGWTGAWFDRVIQLSTGGFMVVGAVPGWLGNTVLEWFFFLMVLDEDLSILKIRFFNNSTEEFENRPYGRFRAAQNLSPILLDNGDVIILMDDIQIDENYYEGYSIYRFTPEGDIVDIWDYTIDPTPPPFAAGSTGFASDWTLDLNGNVVVYGLKSDLVATKENEGATRDNNLFVSLIDLSSGALLKTTIFANGNYAFAWNGGIQPTSNGFVVSDYHIDTIGEDNWDINGDGFRDFYGGLWYLDQNLDSIGKAHITPAIVDQLQGNLVRTQDLGYVQAFRIITQAGSNILVVKADAVGNPLWSYSFDANGVVKMIETNDGGIAILFSSDFNRAGDRVKLLKLSANGKL